MQSKDNWMYLNVDLLHTSGVWWARHEQAWISIRVWSTIAWPKIHSLILSLETKVAHKLQALEIREWQALPFLQCFVNKLLSQKIPSSEVNTSKVWRLYFKCTGIQTLRKAGWIRFRSLLINIWLSNTIGTKSDHIQIRIMRVNLTFSP